MILGFKTKFQDGTLTDFEKKILSGQKIHTFREGERWKKGNSIQMATGVRTKYYNQFNKDRSDLGKCISVQDTYMTLNYGELDVLIDDVQLPPFKHESLFRNDGLTKDQFIKWFFPFGDDLWCGQIIHWTNFKY